MNEKLKDFLNSQIPITVLSIALGVGLIFLPAGTMGVLCRVLFGVVFMLTGGYHIFRQVMERPGTVASMPDLYAGVVILVLGVFLFANPAVVLMMLPWMLGAFIIADSIWMIKTCIRMQKENVGFWKVMLIASAACIVMALILALYRFEQVGTMLTYAGWLFLLNGLADVVLTWMVRKQTLAASQEEQIPQGDETDLIHEPQEAGESVPTVEEAVTAENEAAALAESEAAVPAESEAAAPAENGAAAPAGSEAAAPTEYEAAVPAEHEIGAEAGFADRGVQDAGSPAPESDGPFCKEPSPVSDTGSADHAPMADGKEEAETAQETLPKPEPAPWEKTARAAEPEEEPVKMEEDAKAPWESSVDPFKMQ